MRWKKDTSTIEKYCSSRSCNTTSSQNRQESSRMRYAQYLRNYSRNRNGPYSQRCSSMLYEPEPEEYYEPEPEPAAGLVAELFESSQDPRHHYVADPGLTHRVKRQLQERCLHLGSSSPT